MTLPSAGFALLTALLIGSVFHLVVDGGPGRLILYMILSTVGFAAGQWLADSQAWSLLSVGPLQMGTAVAGSLVFLLVGHWLSQVNIESGKRDDTV